MAATMWKEKLELSECVESARRKLRTARQAQANGRTNMASAARHMAANNMQRARFLKNKIESFRQSIRRSH